MAYAYETVIPSAGLDLFEEAFCRYMESLGFARMSIGGRLGAQTSHEFQRDDDLVSLSVHRHGPDIFQSSGRLRVRAPGPVGARCSDRGRRGLHRAVLGSHARWAVSREPQVADYGPSRQIRRTDPRGSIVDPEDITRLVFQLAVILTAAKLAGEIFERYLKLPSVLGELAAGHRHRALRPRRCGHTRPRRTLRACRGWGGGRREGRDTRLRGPVGDCSGGLHCTALHGRPGDRPAPVPALRPSRPPLLRRAASFCRLS